MHEEGQGGVRERSGGGQGITMVDCICTGFYPFKGPTIRKVMGGRGIFELQEFFFVIKFLV